MNFQKFLIPAAGVAIVYMAYRFYGWGGVGMAASVLVTWGLLHFTRMMQVLKRAAARPVGYVDSAVMLNAKLKPKASLLHVVAMTRAIGELRSPKGDHPEIFRWTDGSNSFVDCTFVNGKLAGHSLTRPIQSDVDADDSGSPTINPPPAP
ncbi:MAG: glycerate kinase [Polaromonas sp.]|jgi:hypothetical protein